MRHIKSDVVTVGFGGCMGMSGFLLAVGKKVCCTIALLPQVLNLKAVPLVCGCSQQTH